jgi:hypothetical protein
VLWVRIVVAAVRTLAVAGVAGRHRRLPRKCAFMQIRSLGAGLAVVLMVLSAQADPASAEDAGRRRPFAAQAKAAGLSAAQAETLQARVDALVAADGGTQIAANQVRWADGRGDTTLPFPGEKRTRAIGAASDTAPCGDGYLCLFESTNFLGTKYSLYYCVDYPTPYAFNSYKNHQSYGTVGTFKDRNRNPIDYTVPAPFDNSYYSGAYAYHVKPC